MKYIPNILTFLRILCIPLVIYFFNKSETVYSDDIVIPNFYDWISVIIFTFAAITDFFDGFLARKLRIESVLGKILDPIADKLLVISVIIILVEKQKLFGWLAILLIVRELVVNDIRFSDIRDDNLILNSSWIGKWKSFFLDFSLPCFMLYGTIGDLNFNFFFVIGFVFIIISLILSWYSGIIYLIKYFKSNLE